jgi:hypothetical protein
MGWFVYLFLFRWYVPSIKLSVNCTASNCWVVTIKSWKRCEKKRPWNNSTIPSHLLYKPRKTNIKLLCACLRFELRNTRTQIKLNIVGSFHYVFQWVQVNSLPNKSVTNVWDKRYTLLRRFMQGGAIPPIVSTYYDIMTNFYHHIGNDTGWSCCNLCTTAF